MSQWGQRLSVAGAEFIPLVAGRPFEPIAADQAILDIICVEIAGDGDRARRALDRLKRRHVGKPYQRWLDAGQRRSRNKGSRNKGSEALRGGMRGDRNEKALKFV